MRVIIIGAGLAGLCVAAGLAQSGHDVSIYERDQSAEDRDQGFYIGLMPNTGIGALRSAGLAEAAFKSGRANTSLAFLDHTGESLFALRLPPAYAMLGISRRALRKLLLDAALDHLGSGAIHWGHRFGRFEESPSQVRVHFENGQSTEGDVLIGCDGVHSGVRAQRLGDALVELHVVSLRGILRSAALAQHELLASGGFLTVGGGGCVFAQGFDADQLLWCYSAAASGPLSALESAQQRLSWLGETLASWHDPIPALVKATDLSGLSEPYVLLDREPMSAAEGGRVLLLGDAAHPMSPFQGQGGNMALVDAVDLTGRFRGATATDIPELVRQFERACLQRSHQPWLSSRRAVLDFHAANARERVLEWRHGPLT